MINAAQEEEGSEVGEPRRELHDDGLVEETLAGRRGRDWPARGELEGELG